MISCWFCGNFGHLQLSCYARINLIRDIKFELSNSVDFDGSWRAMEQRGSQCKSLGEQTNEPEPPKEQLIQPEHLDQQSSKPQVEERLFMYLYEDTDEYYIVKEEVNTAEESPINNDVEFIPTKISDEQAKGYSQDEVNEFNDLVTQYIREDKYYGLEITDKKITKFKRRAKKRITANRKEKASRFESRICITYDQITHNVHVHPKGTMRGTDIGRICECGSGDPT